MTSYEKALTAFAALMTIMAIWLMYKMVMRIRVFLSQEDAVVVDAVSNKAFMALVDEYWMYYTPLPRCLDLKSEIFSSIEENIKALSEKIKVDEITALLFNASQVNKVRYLHKVFIRISKKSEWYKPDGQKEKLLC